MLEGLSRRAQVACPGTPPVQGRCLAWEGHAMLRFGDWTAVADTGHLVCSMCSTSITWLPQEYTAGLPPTPRRAGMQHTCRAADHARSSSELRATAAEACASAAALSSRASSSWAASRAASRLTCTHGSPRKDQTGRVSMSKTTWDGTQPPAAMQPADMGWCRGARTTSAWTACAARDNWGYTAGQQHSGAGGHSFLERMLQKCDGHTCASACSSLRCSPWPCCSCFTFCRGKTRRHIELAWV